MTECNCMLVYNPITERDEWKVAPLSGCKHTAGERCDEQMGGVFNGEARRAACVLARGHAGYHDDDLGTTWGNLAASS